MSNFTKGPWTKTGDAVFGAEGFEVVAANFPLAHGKRGKEAESNTALMMAAPDLYEALGSAIKMLRLYTSPDDELAQAGIEQLEETRRKAEGIKESEAW